MTARSTSPGQAERMNHRRIVFLRNFGLGLVRGRAMYALAAILLSTVPALAADLGGDGRKSLLTIIREGIEVPTYFILVGSVVVIALIVEHFLTIRTIGIAPLDQVKRTKQQIERRNFRECLDTLSKSQTFFARVMTAALQHARHGFDAMHEAALEKSGQLSGRMFRKAEYLNIFGNLGPLLGLLGTVWGMIEAFGSLGAGGGQAGAGDLAGGISKALVNTLLGLALAILGIGFFGVCRNRIESLTVAATVEVLDLLEYFRPIPATAAPRPPERPVAPPPPTPAVTRTPLQPGS
jgi:biopolymer transport protein ExbB